MTTVLPINGAVDDTTSSGGSMVLRIAITCLALHSACSIFSAVAFATFLTSPPEWLQTEVNQRALVIGWRYGPAGTVVLGALAALLHAGYRLGWSRTLPMFAIAFVVSLSSELAGTATGLPFGPYVYSSILGYKIGGLVPFNIPTSWFYMLYASLAICGGILARSHHNGASLSRRKWTWAFVAGIVLTAWDVSMDPAMVRTNHWMWQLPAADSASLWQRIFLSDLFYGMPLLNWIGWLLTGTLVARLMLAIVPPLDWTRHVASTRFPLLLYAVNGVLPVTICVRFGMMWAAVLGAVAMLVPLLLAWRARPARFAAWPSTAHRTESRSPS